MSKLHYCVNGNSVTEQVEKYLKSKLSDDFLPILLYYDNFRKKWFEEVSDYIDRNTFDSDFEYKLLQAVNTFNPDKARDYAELKKISQAGSFNRWFYRILLNWRSNVKNNGYRLKKRPGVHCPVCGRETPKIDEQHLKHIKTVQDMPKFFLWQNNIFQFFNTPKTHAISWGSFYKNKFEDLNNGKVDDYITDRRRIQWPWRLPDGKRGILCPFINKIVNKIDNDYILNLPDKYNRYADPLSWSDFVQRYPYALTQAEIYSIEHEKSEGTSFGDTLIDKNNYDFFTPEMLDTGFVPPRYESVFKTIDKLGLKKDDNKLLKLLSVGYELEEISSILNIEIKNIKNKIRSLKSFKSLEQQLIKE